MGKKFRYDYDPYAAAYAQKLSAQADKISQLASGYDTKSPLTEFGKSEIEKVTKGQYGNTLLAGVARNAAARDIQAAKDSQGLGTAAMRAGANNPNSLLSHQRLLRRATNEANNRAADQVVQGMPGYLSAAGDWANTDNNLLSQKIAAEAGVGNTIGQAASVQRAGTTVTEKKGFWSNLMSGLQSVAGIAAGFGLSDERAKEEVKPLKKGEATKKIKALKPRRYKYKEGMGDEGEHVGVMAQDVAKVESNAVRTRADKMKEVNYRSLFSTNVAATKELIGRVEKLEQKERKK